MCPRGVRRASGVFSIFSSIILGRASRKFFVPSPRKNRRDRVAYVRVYLYTHEQQQRQTDGEKGVEERAEKSRAHVLSPPLCSCPYMHMHAYAEIERESAWVLCGFASTGESNPCKFRSSRLCVRVYTRRQKHYFRNYFLLLCFRTCRRAHTAIISNLFNISRVRAESRGRTACVMINVIYRGLKIPGRAFTKIYNYSCRVKLFCKSKNDFSLTWNVKNETLNRKDWLE